jgi:hypothetical protein
MRRRARLARTRCRVGRRGQAGAPGPPDRCRARAGICAVEEARRFRALPRSHLPVARLRSARIRLRPRQRGWVGVTPGGGPTHASNLKCYCRTHHLVKTFWGWRDQQLPDGTIILTSPSGQTYVTTPGSALLFPSLCVPTGDLRAPEFNRPVDNCGDRTAMMPRRRRTRQQDRTNRIAAERRQNHRARTTRRTDRLSYLGPAPPDTDDDPPPF